MTHSAHSSYLETQVLTATPQKLRLMLIEAAIRFGQQTVDAWNKDDQETASESLTRCREIIAELLGGVRPGENDLGRSVADIYWFLFQSLTTARQDRSQERLQEVLRVLQVERETWQKLCEQMPDAPMQPDRPNAPKEITSGNLPAIQSLPGATANSSSVSFDA